MILFEGVGEDHVWDSFLSNIRLLVKFSLEFVPALETWGTSFSWKLNNASCLLWLTLFVLDKQFADAFLFA
jgi:hypothetical protein